MKLSVLQQLFLLAPNALLALAANPPQEVLDSCNKDDAYPYQDNEGNWFCQFCVGGAYKDPKTGVKKCCGIGKTFQTDAKQPTEGACCATGQKYSFDSASGKGSCCPVGQTFTGGSCQTPAPPPPPAPPAPAKSTCNNCPDDYVCACDGNLGIKYGSCYTLTDTNGQPLNREIGGVYQTGGEIGNLIFRVCKSTKDCDELAGTPVPETGSWVLQDQLGDRINPGPGWMANTAPHMSVVPASNSVLTSLAANFVGEPFCFYGQCSLCLRLAQGTSTIGTGLSAPCPMPATPDKTHLGASLNPNNCKAYRFQEIKCAKGVAGKLKA